MLADSDLLKAEKCSYIKADFHQCGDISSPSTDFPVNTCAYVLCVASSSAESCRIKQFCYVVKIRSGREVKFKLELEDIEGKKWWKLWRSRFLPKRSTVVSSSWSDREISSK